MSYNIANTAAQKAGLCPHGLPAGACPICSGGGGGIKKMDRNTRRHPGEMTWNECYAAWMRMKNAKAQKAAEIEYRQNIKEQNVKMKKAEENVAKILEMISNAPVFKPVKIVVQKFSDIFCAISAPIAKAVQKFTGFIKNTFVDITDKLAAIFGEEKLAKLKNIKDFTERAVKKVLSLFGFINESKKEEETSDEVRKEEKRVSFLQKIRRKLHLIKEENDDR